MSEPSEGLRRRLNLPLLVLYGVGVTVGAGIYVLIGPVAGHAGSYAPLAFIMAAIVMGLTVGSYAELCTRYPIAAGESAYVKAAFRLGALSKATGLLMIGSGIIAAATVAVGSTGYIEHFLNWPRQLTVAIVIVALGIISAWGVLESVLLASLFTLIEVGGLLLIIVAAAKTSLPIGDAVFAIPPMDSYVWLGISFGGLLAFFAFTGFEDLTNMVEEARAPERDVPVAMAITLAFTTVLYVVIAAIAVTALPIELLATSDAPLTLVYFEIAGVGSKTISAIAIVATLNTVIAQMTMATRVIYGMARQGDLPRIFGNVHSRTHTPHVATFAVIVFVLLLAWLMPFERLAEFTSVSTLIVFSMVNLALLKLRLWRSPHERKAAIRVLRVPIIVPVLGLITCLVMLTTALI